jgi:hypothetical protein
MAKDKVRCGAEVGMLFDVLVTQEANERYCSCIIAP